MSKEKNTQTQTEKKHLTIANVFEVEAKKGGTKKEIASRMIATLKANGQAQTKRKILMETAVPRQMNAMMAELEKKGRWAKFKNVGKDDQVKLEKITTVQ